MRPVLYRFSIAAAGLLALTSCTGETDYDVLDDYNATSSDPTVTSARAGDAGTHASPSRGTDAGIVAHRSDAAAPPPAPTTTPPPPTDPSPLPPKKKKGKGHDDD